MKDCWKYYCYTCENIKFVMKDVFEKFYIEHRTHIIKIWLYIARVINTVQYSRYVNPCCKLIIFKKNKISRVALFREEQIVSLNFPFKIIEKDNVLVPFIKDIEIDNRKIINLLGVVNNEAFLKSSWDCDLSNLFANLDHDIENELWILLKELLISDDGYIRYDYDLRNHPEVPNHLDIFLSNDSSFKLGVNEKLNFELLLDILDNETNPYFLKR